ncbi:MAG: KTSC domain-containing protein [Methanoregula sp.]|uniref:KTSC domain-containing protein n=2 Tax=Methanoregula sp. TaxID=2052170 RepID=UPI003BAE390E
MLRQAVQSSNLKSVGYDYQQNLLEIEFISGGIYQYSSVPKDMYSGLMDAPSHGKFFARFIKDRFPTKRVR